MKKSILLASLLAALPSVGWSQSKIQCVQGPDGSIQAAQIWQNTLGVARANNICSSELRAVQSSPNAGMGEVRGRFDKSTYVNAAKQNGVDPAQTGARSPATQVGQGSPISEAPDIPVGFERIW